MRKGIIDGVPIIELIGKFFMASAITGIFYLLFFHYSVSIWSLNMVKPLPEFTPWTRPWIPEHDGIEAYVLYVIMFGISTFMMVFNHMFKKINKQKTRNITYLFMVLFSFYFYFQIGFHPPMPAAKLWPEGLFFIALIAFITLILVKYNEASKWLLSILALSLLVVCLIPTEWISLFDYTYVLTPALRVVAGYKLTESYFRYDYLLSLLAVLWLKLNLSVYSFYKLGGVSYFFLFVGMWFFAKRFLSYKPLAIYLLVSLVIIKIYGNMHDPVYIIEVTPLRLDWWLAVLAGTYWKGIQHWLVGLLLGFLIIFHNTFGLIYAFSYLLLILFLAFIEGLNNITFRQLVQKYYQLYAKNFIIILAAMLFYKLFFKSSAETTALVFQKYGHGFLPISRTSFYWYIPVITSLLSLLVLRSRKLLSEKYFQTSIFLVILALGNSLYFFGRSHEHNIINIASSLLLCVFVLFDLAHTEINRNSYVKINRFIIPIMAFAFVIGVGYTYSDRASNRIKQQCYLAVKNKTVNRLLPSPIIEEVKVMTSESAKVIFMAWFDFPYYYEGRYIPQGYYSFTSSWIFSKDYIDFLNAQLVKGYYLVMPIRESFRFEDIIVNLKYKRKVTSRNFVVMSS
ncbi:MAG: hypothetical protein HY920_01830 [Elusimicrobia bacterium]|nr:hypothetical protein [Elusimicrobiota bacterium]